MATIVVVCLFSYIDCCIRNTPMVDCYIRCHNIFHIFQYTSVDCCVDIAKFLCCKRSFCKKTFVDWVSIDAPWLIVVFVCILHTLFVNRHHILYTKMPPLLCIINPNMLFIPSRAPLCILNSVAISGKKQRYNTNNQPHDRRRQHREFKFM